MSQIIAKRQKLTALYRDQNPQKFGDEVNRSGSKGFAVSKIRSKNTPKEGAKKNLEQKPAL